MSYLDPAEDQIERYVPGIFALIFGSVFPAAVILIELVSGLCADAFFDPMPSAGHMLLVSAVPAINALLWCNLRRNDQAPRWLIAAGAASVAVAISYVLLLLPILPIAFIAIVALGIGLLPFAPVTAMIAGWRWTAVLASTRERTARLLIAGAVSGFAALALVDLPATATQIALQRYEGDAAERSSAVNLMRLLGDSDVLLRLSYGDSGRASGVAGFLISGWTDGPFSNERLSTRAARELYYRATGEAFNARGRSDAGFGRTRRAFRWDDDQGGKSVGGRVEGLRLAGSRIDGSVAERDNLAYVEWTFDFANRETAPAEARFTIALPEGAVASRATLWIDGEPREASIAGRAETRRAYEAVVNRSRDPLLVTTDGAQRLLVQAFPIPANDSLRLRIGYTAPFQIAPNGRRSLALPAIVERNFDLAQDFRHAIWIEGDARIGGPAHLAIPNGTLLDMRPRLTLPVVKTAWERTGGLSGFKKLPGIAVEQRIARTSTTSGPLIVLLDTSSGMEKSAAALKAALPTVPDTAEIGLIVAGSAVREVPHARFDAAQRARFDRVLAATRFGGGQDDRPALAAALARLPRGDAALLWLHGPQPVAFAAPEPALDQALERLPALPQLVRYQAQPGRALAPADSAWFDRARMVTPSGDAAADLTAMLGELTANGLRWSIRRERVTGEAATSANIARLWAAQEIIDSLDQRPDGRDRAVALAHRLNLITPVSGAVVLETKQDYAENGLPVPDADAVPTVPEPEVWALALLLALAAAWMLLRRRRELAA